MTAFETFVQLHYNGAPLLIGNVWDVVSAKTLERSGFKAVATSSAAIAHTWGYEDGEKMPFDLLLKVVERIISNISIPLSVDIEAGYSRDISKIIQKIEKLHELGVVGINIEDSVKSEKPYMQSINDFQKKNSTISNHLEQKNIKIFLNARTDAFLLRFHHRLPKPLQESRPMKVQVQMEFLFHSLPIKMKLKRQLKQLNCRSMYLAHQITGL